MWYDGAMFFLCQQQHCKVVVSEEVCVGLVGCAWGSVSTSDSVVLFECHASVCLVLLLLPVVLLLLRHGATWY
jgi:hypothetical protein